jgi:23S rRNA pseudouridine1911/1915/1917 synthase
MKAPPSSLTVLEAEPDRADRMLARMLPGEPSRAAAARLIRAGRVFVQGRPVRPSTILKPGDRVRILPPKETDTDKPRAETPPFSILFEDRDIIVPDKPPGLVVHPGAGRPDGTLADVLLQSRPGMTGVGESGRWGIVHRLDKDTSGVMVVAKTGSAHTILSAAFARHAIHRVYIALVRGDPGRDEGIVDAPLGRHERDRKRISTATAKPRRAVTKWKVKERFGGLTLLQITPETGRTHQIRVHLAHAGLPVVGDGVYGRPRRKGGVEDPYLRRAVNEMKRQALHAAELGFVHPRSGDRVLFVSPLARDMERALAICRKTPIEEF